MKMKKLAAALLAAAVLATTVAPTATPVFAATTADEIIYVIIIPAFICHSLRLNLYKPNDNPSSIIAVIT